MASGSVDDHDRELEDFFRPDVPGEPELSMTAALTGVQARNSNFTFARRSASRIPGAVVPALDESDLAMMAAATQNTRRGQQEAPAPQQAGSALAAFTRRVGRSSQDNSSRNRDGHRSRVQACEVLQDVVRTNNNSSSESGARS